MFRAETGVVRAVKILPLTGLSSRLAVIAVLALLLAAAGAVSLRFGVLEMSDAEFLEAWRAGNPVLVDIRLPRLLLGALVGAALAVSGAILQTVLRNPLASPGILGVSAGGGLAGVAALLLLPQYPFLPMPAAFCGALAAALTVYLSAWRRGIEPVRLILAGVALAALLGALSTLMLLLNSERAAEIIGFTVGDLSGRGWKEFRLGAPWLAAGLLLSPFFSRSLNLLRVGDETALSLGMPVERVRFRLLALASLLASASVGVAGLLGFVGLIAPHCVRAVIGSDHRLLLPGSALAGALLTIGSDFAGRMISPPLELPAGVVMALLGPVFFLGLLLRSGVWSGGDR